MAKELKSATKPLPAKVTSAAADYRLDGVKRRRTTVDDAEISAYLHNKEESQFKTIVWEIMYNKYLKEKQLNQVSKGKNKIKKKRKEEKSPAKKMAEKRKDDKEEKKSAMNSKINYDALRKLMAEDENQNGPDSNLNGLDSNLQEKSGGDGDGDGYGDGDGDGDGDGLDLDSEEKEGSNGDDGGDYCGDMYYGNEEDYGDENFDDGEF